MFFDEHEKEVPRPNATCNPYEFNRVQNGRGVYAWIEHRGYFFEGDIPGISGIMKVRMARSYQDCLKELKENLENSTAIEFTSFRQKESFTEIQRKHPSADIVFIPIHR